MTHSMHSLHLCDFPLNHRELYHLVSSYPTYIFSYAISNRKYIFLFLSRCNSKASYLPRQSREKLNIDPDHGIYKLTLTSNEDCINHNNNSGFHAHHAQHTTDLLASSKCNNLPDVLPVGVKIHHPASQNAPRYGSNNNISTAQQHHMNNRTPTSPQTAPPHPHYHPHYNNHHHHQHPNHQSSAGYPLKSVFNFNINRHNGPTSPPTVVSPTPPILAYGRGSGLTSSTESLPAVAALAPIQYNSASPTKFVSQSNIDLKNSVNYPIAVHNNILTTNSDTNKMLEPEHGSEPCRQSPYSIRHEFVSRKSSLEDHRTNSSGSGAIRSSASPTSMQTARKEASDKVIRKDSLKENIDKITQLQSKLMASHVHDQEKLSRESSFRKEKIESEVVAVPPAAVTTISTATSPIQMDEPAAFPSKTTEAILMTSTSSDVDSLKLLQRTELVLRVSAPTSEAASQTDDTLEKSSSPIAADICDPKSADSSCPPSPSRIIRYSESAAAELDCVQLSQELMRHLSPSDRLHHILGKFTNAVFKVFISNHDFLMQLLRPIDHQQTM